MPGMGPLPEEIVKEVAVQLGAVIVALLALIGTAVTSYLNYKANQKQKKSQAELEAERRANEQAEIARKAKEDVAIQAQEVAFAEVHRELRSLSNTLSTIQREVSISNKRLDKFNQKTNARISDVEESLGKVTQILARNARQNTEMLHMHRQTDCKIKAILSMEISNFTFTKKTSNAIHSIGDVIADVHDGKDEIITRIIDHLSQSQDEFIRETMKAQVELSNTTCEFISDGQDSQLNAMLNHRCHPDIDEESAIRSTMGDEET